VHKTVVKDYILCVAQILGLGYILLTVTASRKPGFLGAHRGDNAQEELTGALKKRRKQSIARRSTWRNRSRKCKTG
jgi:hypothetical protein